MKKICLLFLLLTLLFACSKKIRIIPPDDLVNILADMHLADATIDLSKYKKFKGYDTVIYQKYVLEKYGYTQEEFDSTIVYYSHNVKDIKEIYEKVIEVLQHQQTSLQDQNIDTTVVPDQYAENIWTLKDNWDLPQDGERENIDFEFPLKGKGKYTLKADIKIFPDDQSENPRINVFFYKKVEKRSFGRRKYFKSVLLEKNGVLISHVFDEELNDTIYTHIKGQILSHTNMSNDHWKKHAEIRNIVLLFEPSDSTASEIIPNE